MSDKMRVAMIDAAMVEMKNLYPPLSRTECARLIDAAWQATQPVPVVWEPNEDIEQLMKFYAVNDLLSLVRVQSEHVARLQKKLPPMRDEQPRNPRSGGE